MVKYEAAESLQSYEVGLGRPGPCRISAEWQLVTAVVAPCSVLQMIHVSYAVAACVMSFSSPFCFKSNFQKRQLSCNRVTSASAFAKLQRANYSSMRHCSAATVPAPVKARHAHSKARNAASAQCASFPQHKCKLNEGVCQPSAVPPMHAIAPMILVWPAAVTSLSQLVHAQAAAAIGCPGRGLHRRACCRSRRPLHVVHLDPSYSVSKALLF